jgi:chemotaxis signal transduction protein
MEKLETLYAMLKGPRPVAGASTLESVSGRADSAGYDPNCVAVVVFSIGKRVFAIGAENTEGVVDCPRICPLPSAPDAIVGVVSVRGRITLVLDASLEGTREGTKRRLILLKGETQLGLLADQIQAVDTLDPEEIRRIPENRSGKRLLGGNNGGTPGIKLARSYFKRGGRKVALMEPDLMSELSS